MSRSVSLLRTPRHARATSTSLPPRTYRPELHGVRGLALLLVVIFHLFGNGRISGGIDVFLAITGFLFTQSLLRKAVEGTGRIGLREHFGRIGQRLIPPVIVTLGAVVLATLAWLPSTRWLQVSREVTASLLYVENWELIASQLDYEAAGPSSSPLQHFWSLSIQGQFHLVWPFVVMAAVSCAMRLRRSPLRWLTGLTAAVTGLSFVYSVWLTHHDQAVAYYHTGARLWQLTIGGLAALTLPYLTVPSWLRSIFIWAGLAMITAGGFVFEAHNFPGFASLWPVSGLLLILAAGTGPSPVGPQGLLVAKPLTFVADISYALYLWHWPVLIYYLAVRERAAVGFRGALVVLAISVLLAWATTQAIERTVHFRLTHFPARRRFAVLAGTVAAAALISGSSVVVLDGRQERAIAASIARSTDQPGAAALVAGGRVTDVDRIDPEEVVPLLAAAARDVPEVYSWGCTQNLGDSPRYDEVLVCDDATGSEGPRVVMTGGSHVQQWWPAMSAVAELAGWELIVIDKDGCQLTADRDPSRGAPLNSSCYRWNEAAIDVIVELEPDAVFALGSTTRGGQEWTPDGFVEVWRQLQSEDIPVLAIRDTVRLPERVPDCLARVGYNAQACGVERSEILADSYPADGDMPTNVTFIDMTDLICEPDLCPAIIGNVIVYRDASHVSATYMKSLAPFFEQRLRQDAGWLFPSDR